jgi:uncharacterized protein involved in type VI secretion and phage assembly
MSINTKTTITIGGRDGSLLPYPFANLEIHQDLYGHHRFELEIAAEELVKQGSDEFEELTSMVGEMIYIMMEPKKTLSSADEEFQFKGVITQVLAGKKEGTNYSKCIIKGADPTILMQDAPGVATYKDKSLSHIYKDVLSNYPVNTLKREVSPQYSKGLAYIVRYRENGHRFLERLSGRYGEWFYYNGEKLYVGQRESADPITLTYGVNLDSFHYQMNTYPSDITMVDYDYRNDKPLQEQTTSHDVGGLDRLTQKLKKKSESVFPNQSSIKMNQHLGRQPQSELRHMGGETKKSSLSNLKVLNGNCSSLDCRVGREVQVKESVSAKKDHGRYMITSLSHRCTSEGQYENIFTAVPVSVASPYVNVNDHPVAETQSAVVIDNNDPDDLGRVQVQFRWQESGRTPWLRMVIPGGGKDKGFHMIPEKGEEVMVDFAGGNPERPYVLGATRNGSSASGFGTETNDIKAIRTRSGHTIELNDKQGGEFITIKDKNGNKINIDTANDNMTITAQKNMTLNAKNFELNVKEDANLNIGKNTGIQTGENLDISAKNVTQVVQKNIKLENSGKYTQMSAEAVVQSDGDLKLSGAGLASVKGGSDVKISKG